MNEDKATNPNDPFPLSRVVMPMIRTMYDARLSWAERETIAAAINACVIEWHCLMDEHSRHNQPGGINEEGKR